MRKSGKFESTEKNNASIEDSAFRTSIYDLVVQSRRKLLHQEEPCNEKKGTLNKLINEAGTGKLVNSMFQMSNESQMLQSILNPETIMKQDPMTIDELGRDELRSMPSISTFSVPKKTPCKILKNPSPSNAYFTDGTATALISKSNSQRELVQKPSESKNKIYDAPP